METSMAHPDKSRKGSEQGQRQHEGQTTRHSGAGTQSHTPQGQHGKASGSSASGLEPKRPDERPDKQRGEHAGASRQHPQDEAQRDADTLSRGSSDDTPPRGGGTGRQSGGHG
jgi:hypothetical protein